MPMGIPLMERRKALFAIVNESDVGALRLVSIGHRVMIPATSP